MYFQALREFGTQKNQPERIDYMLSSNYKSSNRNVTGADEGNRTPVSTLARLCSTIKLHLHFSVLSYNIIKQSV